MGWLDPLMEFINMNNGCVEECETSGCQKPIGPKNSIFGVERLGRHWEIDPNKKELKELSKEEYKKLLDSGMMGEFYPSASGNYRIDVLGESVSELLDEVEDNG